MNESTEQFTTHRPTSEHSTGTSILSLGHSALKDAGGVTGETWAQAALLCDAVVVSGWGDRCFLQPQGAVILLSTGP